MKTRPDNALSIQQNFEILKSEYQAAKRTRFERRRHLPAYGAPEDIHYANEAEFVRMIELGRDLDRNDSVVGSIITRAVTNVLTGKNGIRVEPRTSDDALDDELRYRWQQWSRDADLCDISGEMTFADMEDMALRQTFVDGDHFVIARDEMRLQMVEGHRCKTPLSVQNRRTKNRFLVHGVELDAQRRPLGYYFTAPDVGISESVKTYKQLTRFPARDEAGMRRVMHVRFPRRISQARGVTSMQPITSMVSDLDDVQFAKIVQQKVVSCFAIFRQRELEADPGMPMAQRGEQEIGQYADQSSRLIEGISPGMEVAGEPGEKLIGFSPSIPNPEFFEHVRLILQIIGMNLGIPLVLSTMDASQTNFSGWRGAIEEARKGFRRVQSQFVRRLHTPVYEWLVRHWMQEEPAMARATGWTIGTNGVVERGNDPKVNPFRHDWTRPEYPYINPLQDATTDLVIYRNGMTSPRRFHNERNRDWGEVHEEIIEDNSTFIEKARIRAKEMNQAMDDGQPVHWRDLISLPTPQGMSVAVNASANIEDAQSNSEAQS